MKIIDFHVHTFPEKIAASAIKQLSSKSHTKNFTDGTVNALANSMKEAGVNYSVLQPVATNPKQVTKINDVAIKINNEGKTTGIFSFGAIHPDFENFYDELKRIYDFGIKGIKIHPVYQGVDVDDERYINILEAANEIGLAVLIHAGWDIGFPEDEKSMPKKIFNALKSSNASKIILAHMGGWRCWEEAEEIFADIKDVYIDTAFSSGEFTSNGDGHYKSSEECKMLNDEEFLRMIKIFGSDRVIFGTDSPWSSQSECVEKIKSLNLTDKEISDIFYNNASKFIM